MKEPLYDNILEFQVYGESALFCNPITMVSEEQTSYQVPTYSALQGIGILLLETNHLLATIGSQGYESHTP